MSSISPSSIAAGASGFTLTAAGTGFVSGAAVKWDGTALTTTFVSSTQLTATVPASDVTSAGTHSVVVSNPAPGGGSSSQMTFIVTAPQNPAPVLTTISPTTTLAGSVGFTLTAAGSNFVPGATIEWDGVALTTTYVSVSQLTATVPATDIATAGTHQVTVFNPAPGGGNSGQQAFTVTPPPNPAPVASSLSPSSVHAGATAFTLTVNGSGFISGSQILWNGSAITTTYDSSTALTAQIPASDVTTAGAIKVAVKTPAPGGGTSSSLTFTVNATAVTNLQELDLYGSDMVWDAKNQKFYIAAQDGSTATTGSITTVDPVAGKVVSSKALNYIPTGLALSDDSQYLYAVIDGGTTIQRFLVPSMAEDIHWQLGTDSSDGGQQLYATDIRVQPGVSNTLAVAMRNLSSYVAIFDDGVQRGNLAGSFYVNGSTLAWSQDGKTLYAADGLKSDSSFSPHFGYEPNIVLFTMSVTADGPGTPTELQEVFRSQSEHLHLDSTTGNLFDDLGEVVQAAQAIPVGNYRYDEEVEHPSVYGPFMAIDDALEQTFKLRRQKLASGDFDIQVESFDEKTFRPLHHAVLPKATGEPVQFLRWGSSGLAFLTQHEQTSSGGALFLLDGSLVNAGGTGDTAVGSAVKPVPIVSGMSPLTATVGSSGVTLTLTGVDFQPSATAYWNGTALPTTYVSATQVTAQVPASDLTAVGEGNIQVSNVSDGIQLSNQWMLAISNPPPAGTQISVYDVGGWSVVWDEVRSKLYVSQPGVANNGQNGIATIDPLANTIVRSGFIGSDPGKLSIASDGNSMYMGLNGANAVGQLSLPDFTLGSQWNLGGAGTNNGPGYAVDIEAAPANPALKAFVPASFAELPGMLPIVVYDGETNLPYSPPANAGVELGVVDSAQWGGDDTTLYTSDAYGDFSVLGVSASAVTLDHDYDALTNQQGIHYDAATKLIYTDNGSVIDPSQGKIVGSFSSAGIAVVDSTLNRIFVVGQQGANIKSTRYTINSFDQTKLTPLDSISIDNVQGQPTALIRWGTNGLALATLAQDYEGTVMAGPGQLYVISGTFVKPADPTAKPASTKAIPPVYKTWGRRHAANANGASR